MTERPILFSAPMVRALLAGTKSQTRRAVGEQPPEEATVYAGTVGTYSGLAVERHYWKTADDYEAAEAAGKEYVFWPGADDDGFAGDVYGAGGMPCPYGSPENCLKGADRLWVKETFYAYGRWVTQYSAKKQRDEWHFIDMTVECGNWYFYAATGEPEMVASFRRDSGMTPMWWKRPAIFMPRVASRILLEVTEVRVQRLHDIGEQDANDEGVIECDGLLDDVALCRRAKAMNIPATEARVWYAELWDAINGPGSWDANPWVWAVSFKRIARNGADNAARLK
jgi:hypothetical protein